MARHHHPQGESPPGDGSPQDPTYSRDKFYIGGTNSFDHDRKARDVRVAPWTMNLLGKIIEHLPAYRGEFTNAFRNYIVHGVRHDIELIEDPKLKEQLLKDFQLHLDMQEQARNVNKFAEMKQYTNSTRAALELYVESENWMLVTREIERMKKNLEDGLIWEPCASEVRQLIGEYEGRLRNAKPKK